MVKKIVIENQTGVNPLCNQWAVEAIEEFLNKNPKNKGNFEVEDRKNWQPEGSVISADDFEKLKENGFKKMYIRQRDGSYLTPFASTEWFISRARKAAYRNKQKGLDIETLESFRKSNIEKKKLDEIVITITNEAHNPDEATYALEGFAACISSKKCADEKSFKEALSLELEKVIIIPKNSSKLEVDNQPLPAPVDKEEIDDKGKIAYRAFYKNIAFKEGSKYVEDRNNPNFKASLERENGDKLNISANCKDKVSMGMEDKNGQPKIPEYKDFKDIVTLAQKEEADITFSDKSSAEFNARLLIACLEAEPKIKMENQPKLSPEFLQSISPETKAKLEVLNKPKELDKKQILIQQFQPSGRR